ncbi:MAG: UDP-N-acetylglucosamine pyrophosphorylase [Ruminococcus sp.]|nr:UDP-N-acetylglucosamine pyrophosphorylase [Candidatus Apopatosoma intestinale]
MLPEIKELAKKLVSEGIEGFTEIKAGVLVGRSVKIHESAVIEPPAVIGHGCEVRVGAYIRGNVITGENCVIGNSSELKNCILLSRVQVPHYNYVGDSVLGNRAHMGAGAICSNLKSDKGNVVVKSDEIYETGLRKFGAILGDGADIGCGSVLNPGTVIGRESSVYPLTSVRGVIPCGCIVKSSHETVVRKISDREGNR